MGRGAAINIFSQTMSQSLNRWQSCLQTAPATPVLLINKGLLLVYFPIFCCAAVLSTIDMSTVGLSTVGLSTVGLSTRDLSTVGLSTKDLSTPGEFPDRVLHHSQVPSNWRSWRHGEIDDSLQGGQQGRRESYCQH